MEILGIGPGEFVLIAIVLLVAVGPERLPTLARQAGRLLVRGRNWLQSSPDAALILRARQELEQELATLRSSLLEVQSVRDEVLDAVKQAESTTGSILSGRVDLGSDVGSIKPPAAVDATGAAATIEPAAEIPVAAADALDTSASAAPATEIPATAVTAAEPPTPAVPQLALDPQSVARRPARIGQAPVPAPAASEHVENGVAGAATLAALESIDLRLQAIMSDMFALQEQLKVSGALAGDWRPPSWEISLPDDTAGEEREEAPVESGEIAP